MKNGGKASFVDRMFDTLIQELAAKGTVQFYVRARPGVSKTQAMSVMDDESVKIDIAAPAEGGKANAELVRYLAEVFGVSKNQVMIVSGATARVKLIRIQRN